MLQYFNIHCFFFISRRLAALPDGSVRFISKLRQNHRISPPAQGVAESKEQAGFLVSRSLLLLTKNPAYSFSWPLTAYLGTRFLVWTVPAALVDSWPGIRPLQLCWQLFESRVEHNAPSTSGLVLIGRRATRCSPSESQRLRWSEIIAKTMRRASTRGSSQAPTRAQATLAAELRDESFMHLQLPRGLLLS